MPDLFAPKELNGKYYDLFGTLVDEFRWVVSIFAQDGAPRAIIQANKLSLLTYYPIRFNANGEPIPLFRSYLFIEYKEDVTIGLCRDTPKFIKILTAHDDEGLLRPMLVRRNSVDENKAMVLAGKYNERVIDRRFYGKGSLVRVIEGTFIDKKVKLEENILPEMRGNRKIKVDIDGIKGTIEIYKLGL
jgi:hypothetical protein